MDISRIAICGGGVASLCLAYALIEKMPHVEVRIFEASQSYREQSAAIGLGSNAQHALSLISPSLRLAVDQAGGVQMDPSTRLMMGSGPDQGLKIGDISPEVPQVVVHRGSFWRALRQLIPDSVLMMGKRIVDISHVDDMSSIELHFSDGTHYEADALIGCDGINSVVRSAILGKDNPAATPIYTRGYGHRLVIPIDDAISAFGQDYCSVRTQHAWIGHNALLITDFLDNGASMQVIIGGLSTPEPWPHSSPAVEWPKEVLIDQLSGWGAFGQSVSKTFTSQDKLFAAGNRVHLDTPTYCKGAMCLAGDAAQTFFPTQAAGTGQAIEDALMLSTVLSACSSRAQLAHTFATYDALRRPRRSDIAKSSIWAALILTGKAPGVGMDREKIAEVLPEWGNNIYEYDLEAAQHEARRMVESGRL